MSHGFVFHPFERPQVPLAQEFANYMSLVVSDAALGSFGANLWGIAITTDLETESVRALLSFESEPTVLDRDEMGEFASAFDNSCDGAVDLDLRWRIVPQDESGPIDRSLIWVRLLRGGHVTLPDDFDERDLKY